MAKNSRSPEYRAPLEIGIVHPFHPSDPRNGSHLVSGPLDPYLLSGFPQPARCDANSLFADMDHVC